MRVVKIDQATEDALALKAHWDKAEEWPLEQLAQETDALIAACRQREQLRLTVKRHWWNRAS